MCNEIQGDDFRCNEVGLIYCRVFGIYTRILTLLREVIVTSKRLQMNLVLS